MRGLGRGDEGRGRSSWRAHSSSARFASASSRAGSAIAAAVPLVDADGRPASVRGPRPGFEGFENDTPPVPVASFCKRQRGVRACVRAGGRPEPTGRAPKARRPCAVVVRARCAAGAGVACCAPCCKTLAQRPALVTEQRKRESLSMTVLEDGARRAGKCGAQHETCSVQHEKMQDATQDRR